jgi:hypothetical protein
MRCPTIASLRSALNFELPNQFSNRGFCSYSTANTVHLRSKALRQANILVTSLHDRWMLGSAWQSADNGFYEFAILDGGEGCMLDHRRKQVDNV